ncbi:ATP-binding protein [Sphingobium soli]|uniref:ATP-binding protein n=1 Tax=Sphingobium soli TaxID=1591116 RepID=A0ABS8H8U9_9SPHN|nr:ATP-binding protein [Sphingobium soli]MCC4234853.1 ATP-binding protein [Sphingobium soli]
MSNVNIKRLVENIRSGTNSYTPLVELVVNGIQAVEQRGAGDGLVEIDVLRNGQPDLTDRLEEVDGFVVKDNGVGFTKRNRDAFDTLYTDLKAADGGKGFGRFTCLKYFERVKVKSTFAEDGSFFDRSFRMGLGNEIVVDEKVAASDATDTGSEVEISGIKSVKFPDKGLDVISRVVVERLLPYFVDKERVCPRIVIRDHRSTTPIALNDYLARDNTQIIELAVENPTFSFPSTDGDRTFHVRVFKFFAPRASKSKVALVAHRREVTENPLQTYIPEFAEEFFEPSPDQGDAKGRNFVIKAYVFGDYLNENVSLERGEFRFQSDSDLLNGISQTQIEQRAAEIAQSAVGAEISERRLRKDARIAKYVETQAPWHRILSKEVDFSGLPMSPSHQEIEIFLQKKKYEREVSTRTRVSAILNADEGDDLGDQINSVIASISETSKSDLIHYVSMRRCVLDLFGKALELGPDGKYRSEGEVHDIIFPRRADSDGLDYNDHNLWMLDERLNFASYVISDKPTEASSLDRTDVTVFNRPVVFRAENEPSNPVTIFEFKKPQRDDFVNPSSKEDPVNQIVRYVNLIRNGKVRNSKGREIRVSATTPFYGYIVCDLTPKVNEWLEFEQNFTPMADGMGWFDWRKNIHLYMEVISWDKLLRDAEMRNKVFFHKLGID